MSKFLLALLLILPLSAGATIQVITENGTVQNATADETFTGVTDTYIDEDAATTNYSAEVFMYARENGGSNRRRVLLWFDLSNIPAGATINSATLYLSKYGGDTAGNVDIEIYRLKRTWVVGQATWNDYATSTGWGTAGADNTTSDRDATPIVTTTTANDASGTYQNLGNIGSWVQDVVDGTITNQGILLLIDNAGFLARHWFSSNETDDTRRPELVIDYTESGGAVIPVLHHQLRNQ